MNIKLKTLELHNFKGIKKLKINLGMITNIKGANGLGKSTIMDSFMWLLFDKDSKDRKNFEIKTIDKNGEVMHGLEHSVIGTLEVNGHDIILGKTYKEKWTKKRGMATKEFTGHETLYSINKVPVKKKDFEEKIKEILDEKIFKLVTNPYYFSSLPWKEQRAIIQEIIGNIDDEKVINYNNNLKPLEDAYEDSVENYSIRVKSTIKKLNDKIKQIPFRIDECNNTIVELNFNDLEVKKSSIENEIENIDEQLQDASKGNKILLQYKQHLYDSKQEYQDKLNHAKSVAKNPLDSLQTELHDHMQKVQECSYEINSLERDKRNLEEETKSLVRNISATEENVQELRNEFMSINKRKFELDSRATVCPTCNRELDNSEEIIKELEEKFNLNKAKDKENINKKGQSLNKKIEEFKLKIDENKAKLFDIEKLLEELRNKKLKEEQEVKATEEKINNFKTPLDSEIEFEDKIQLENEIKATKNDIENFNLEDNSGLKDKKRKLQLELSEINRSLAFKDNNEKLRNRIEELENEERELSNKVAKLEGQVFLCEEFVRTKVELSESLINKKFKNISFKLFNNLINGGLEETCEILIDGVPFSNANTASQINAGIEVINTLSKHYGVQAVIFIDNAESVNKIADTDSQIIKLIVTNDKELVVEVEE